MNLIKTAKFLLVGSMGLLAGCASIMGNPESTDGSERGLSYVAGAIVLSAIIRAIFNE